MITTICSIELERLKQVEKDALSHNTEMIRLDLECRRTDAVKNIGRMMVELSTRITEAPSKLGQLKSEFDEVYTQLYRRQLDIASGGDITQPYPTDYPTDYPTGSQVGADSSEPTEGELDMITKFAVNEAMNEVVNMLFGSVTPPTDEPTDEPTSEQDPSPVDLYQELIDLFKSGDK